MEVRIQTPSIVGLFGLYHYYIIKDALKAVKRNAWFMSLAKATGRNIWQLTEALFALLVAAIIIVAVCVCRKD